MITAYDRNMPCEACVDYSSHVDENSLKRSQWMQLLHLWLAPAGATGVARLRTESLVSGQGSQPGKSMRGPHD